MELNPFSSPYLTLVFEHDDRPEPGNYSSDFHATGGLEQKKKKKSDNRAVKLLIPAINTNSAPPP